MSLSRNNRFAGFTLIELLVSVALLAMIILATSYIFDTTVSAVSLNQATAESSIRLSTFTEQVRYDLKAVERGGFLIFGRRELEGYGSPADRANKMKRTMRTDWMLLTCATQQEGGLDSRAIGQWSKIFYGHGKASDPTNSGFRDETQQYPFVDNLTNSFSNVGTDWVLLRNQIIMLSSLLASSTSSTGIESPSTGGTYEMGGSKFERGMLSYVNRQFHWYGAFNYQWIGNFNWNVGDVDFAGRRLAVYEPVFYHTMPYHSTGDVREYHALPHCGSFRVQYAMAEDLRSGSGGKIAWRDGPLFHDPRRSDSPPAVGAYPDPNYSASDPYGPHISANIPVGVQGTKWYYDGNYAKGWTITPVTNAGRIVFGPGDRWPSLIKITVEVWDPLDRLSGPMKGEVVVAIY